MFEFFMFCMAAWPDGRSGTLFLRGSVHANPLEDSSKKWHACAK